MLPAIAICQTSASVDTLKSFWGIKFGEKKEVAKKVLYTKGNVTITEKTEGNMSILSVSNAVFSDKKVLLLILKFVNDKFFQATLNYDTEAPNIRRDFESIANALNEKCFVVKTYGDFKYPYKENDQYEETALATGYGKLVAYWSFAQERGISLETKKLETFSVICLIYEDGALYEEAHKENIQNSDY